MPSMMSSGASARALQLQTVVEDSDIKTTASSDDYDFGPYGRRPVDSDTSEYEPSIGSSSSGSAHGNEASREALGGETDDETRSGTHREDVDNAVKREALGDENDSDDGDDSDERQREKKSRRHADRAGRKRGHERAFSEASAASAVGKRPKHQRKAMNPDYVALLNDDIADAQQQYVADDWPALAREQVGLTIWTAEEKELLFEAVSRLGRDDIPGITARLGGAKNALEVRQYLQLLHTAMEQRRADPAALLHAPPLADVPAAVEISTACCRALDAEADHVARRDEVFRDRDEQRHWGPHWFVTGSNCHALSAAALAAVANLRTDDAVETDDIDDSDDTNDAVSDGGLSVATSEGTRAGLSIEHLAQLRAEIHADAVPPLTLFHVPNMLLVAERIFMNGAAKDTNCLGLGGMPSLRMSALHDLYDIVASLTRRLVAATLHMCVARDDGHRFDKRYVGRRVRAVDVRAAAASLRLRTDARVFWARCPRRLGLRVSRSAQPFADPGWLPIPGADTDAFNPEDSDGGSYDADDDNDIMTFDEVERELLDAPSHNGVSRHLDMLACRPRGTLSGDSSDNSSDSDDNGAYSDEDGSSVNESDASDDDDGDAATATRQRIHDEAEEALRYTVTSLPNTSWARVSLQNHIRNELREEAYTDAVDRHRSRTDELFLWAVLGKSPPPAVLDADKAPHIDDYVARGASRYSVDELIVTSRNWRDRLAYVAEWEATAVEAQRLVDDADAMGGGDEKAGEDEEDVGDLAEVAGRADGADEDDKGGLTA